MSSQTICVAAIQANSKNNDFAENRLHVEPLVAEAAAKGARLVLLPELMFTGFQLNPEIWQWAEPSKGRTFYGLQQQARLHQIWIGTSFLEAEGKDFFNTFVLVNQHGEEVIRVRKSHPAAVEAFVFSSKETTRVVATPFGRIGISICYEAFLSQTLCALQQQQADWVLMPFSAPTPTLNAPLKPEDLIEYNRALANIASETAKKLGCPVLMANKTGAWQSKTPWFFPNEDSYYPGLSTLADSKGRILAQLADEEAVLSGEIEIPTEKPPVVPLVLKADGPDRCLDYSTSFLSPKPLAA